MKILTRWRFWWRRIGKLTIGSETWSLKWIKTKFRHDYIIRSGSCQLVSDAPELARRRPGRNNSDEMQSLSNELGLQLQLSKGFKPGNCGLAISRGGPEGPTFSCKWRPFWSYKTLAGQVLRHCHPLNFKVKALESRFWTSSCGSSAYPLETIMILTQGFYWPTPGVRLVLLWFLWVQLSLSAGWRTPSLMVPRSWSDYCDFSWEVNLQ
jgi:hypothetical protein